MISRIDLARNIIYKKAQKKYYHATFNQLFERIMRQGLKPGSYFSDNPQVAIDHFWKKYDVAMGRERWHRPKEEIEKRLKGIKPSKPMTIVLLEVDIPAEWLERRGRFYYCPKRIPPDRIRMVGNFGQIVARRIYARR